MKNIEEAAEELVDDGDVFSEQANVIAELVEIVKIAAAQYRVLRDLHELLLELPIIDHRSELISRIEESLEVYKNAQEEALNKVVVNMFRSAKMQHSVISETRSVLLGFPVINNQYKIFGRMQGCIESYNDILNKAESLGGLDFDYPESQWPQNPELWMKVKKIIADRLNIMEYKITPDSEFRGNLGADSLDMYELIYAAEENFSIMIPDDKAHEFDTPADAMNYIQEQLKGQ